MPKFKIWGKSDQWFLIYITFNLVDRVGWVEQLDNNATLWPYLAS